SARGSSSAHGDNVSVAPRSPSVVPRQRDAGDPEAWESGSPAGGWRDVRSGVVEPDHSDAWRSPVPALPSRADRPWQADDWSGGNRHDEHDRRADEDHDRWSGADRGRRSDDQASRTRDSGARAGGGDSGRQAGGRDSGWQRGAWDGEP